jgi:hypothetical protein
MEDPGGGDYGERNSWGQGSCCGGDVTYWLNLFTLETWDEFKDAGARISGFSARRWSIAQRIRPGDRLLCYLVRAYRWIGVLRVTGTANLDAADHTRLC